MPSNIKYIKSTGYSYIFLAVISVLALGSTFALTNFDLPISVKTSIFAFIVAVYLIGFTLFYIFQSKRLFSKSQTGANDNPFSSEVDEKLLILEEASEFFAATLKPADMFRLISGRVGEIIPYAACALFLCDEQKSHLKVNQVAGENIRQLKNLSILISEGLAGKTFQKRQPQIDKNLFEDKKVFSRETLQNLKSAIAVPLVRGGEVFGVLQLFAGEETSFDGNSLLLLEAVGERIIPLLTGSMAFERNLSSAMTDSLTNLPNERAFFLVLETQIAESQRFSEKRNLAVLLIDIKNFNELNKTYGHTVGDKILSFTAQTIRKELRQMDFLSRSINDEFFAVLPTADKNETEKIIRRIEKTFLLDRFQISEQTKINIGLNFGFASFNTDGETANELLNIALLKKRQSKSFADSNVLWFPKEFVN
ncbi:MAG: diguanylate cyclase domain-containing protein [Pyrinomonadaceae bacterium]